ncbi:organic cation transporter protein-like [Diadema antillarum]|uniref:organic cation transporter protein-like n=1 Tax=Diadema antillarum TaxID=105358 RepID=UPI003A89E90E
MDLDQTLHQLKDWGRYQTLAFILITIAGTWFPAWQIFSGAFLLAQPEYYHCNPDPGAPAVESCVLRNKTVEGAEKFGAPNCDTCLMYDVDAGQPITNATREVECQNGWRYYKDYPEEFTVVMQMDLVCSRHLWPETAQSIYFAGVLVGAFSAGQLSDMLGRKTIFIVSLLGEGVCGLILAFMTNYYAFVCIWFLVGMFENGINIVEYVLVMEMFAADKRTLAGCINNISWGLGVTLLGPIAWLLKDWRWMQIAISVPCFVGVIYIWLIVESVRWLVSRGRHGDAKKVVEKIAKFNKVPVPPFSVRPRELQCDIMENGDSEKVISEIMMSQKSPTTPSPTFLSIFSKRRLLLNAINMFYQWLMCSLVYYGLSLYSSSLAGDKYLNFFLLGLVEIPAYAIITFTLARWGRRSTLIVANIIAAVACIITAYLPSESEDGTNIDLVIVTFAMLGKLGITCSFGTIFVYGTEIFPTSVRNVGFGLCSFWSRIGGIVAPFVNYLSDIYGPAPLLIFGVTSFVGGATAFFLPETLNRPLPETLKEGDKLHKAKPTQSARPPAYTPGAGGEQMATAT